MRIVGGKWAGRDLTSPNDFRVRPTAERVRAALLDQLKADLPDARVLDLFAGTGALGLEALSRGAKSADFVEFRPACLHALKANVAALRMRDCTRIFKKDALPFATMLTTAGIVKRSCAYSTPVRTPASASTRMVGTRICRYCAARVAVWLEPVSSG